MQVVFLGTLDTWIGSVPFQSIRGALRITFDDSRKKSCPAVAGRAFFSRDPMGVCPLADTNLNNSFGSKNHQGKPPRTELRLISDIYKPQVRQ